MGSVIDYLNTQNKLAEQRPRAPIVLWGKGGSHVRAAVIPPDIEEVQGLPVQGYIVDLNHYAIACETWEEAHYLASVLNSEAVNAIVNAFQTRGRFGNRDIHRRPVQHAPIPLFDSADHRHRRLAELSEELHTKASTLPKSGRAYNEYMGRLGTAMDEVNSIVSKLLH
jgi:hypothetical protein